MFNRNVVQSQRYGPGLAIASNAVLALTEFFEAPVAMEVIRVKLVNGGGSSIASAVSGSAVTAKVYRNASGTASYVGTVTNDGTTIAATGQEATLTAANCKLAAGDRLLIETGTGAGNASALAVGWFVQVDLVYGQAT